MKWTSDQILAVLDRCCDAYTFPMLDNGYMYLALTRLSLHRSEDDWAMVIEVFEYSPRAGLPDLCVSTFGSRRHDRDLPESYSARAHYDNYLANNPHNESRFFHPLAAGKWQDDENGELVALDASELVLRGRPIRIPDRSECLEQGIELVDPERVHVFELCRYLASVAPGDVLATPDEQRISVRPEMRRVLQLDEWCHPNVVDDESRPSGSETFQQLARVLVTGAVDIYRPTEPPNTHWRNWPEGGSL